MRRGKYRSGGSSGRVGAHALTEVWGWMAVRGGGRGVSSYDTPVIPLTRLASWLAARTQYLDHLGTTSSLLT